MMNLHTETSSKKLDCCLCNSEKQLPFKRVDSYQLVKCSECDLVYLQQVTASPAEFLKDVVNQQENGPLEYWGYPDVFKKHADVFNYFFKERLSRILKFSPPAGSWLDIGSGYGLWQTFLNENNIANAGIEIESQAQKFCLSLGLDVHHASVENWQTDKKFAVITMCDVLEHVEDPAAILKKCHDLLLPGGILYVQVPCVLGARYPFNDSLGLPHHIWQFNPKNLSQLARKSLFQVQTYWTGVQGVIKHYEKGEPAWWRKFLWKMAMVTKRGNRLQLLARKI